LSICRALWAWWRCGNSAPMWPPNTPIIGLTRRPAPGARSGVESGSMPAVRAPSPDGMTFKLAEEVFAGSKKDVCGGRFHSVGTARLRCLRALCPICCPMIPAMRQAPHTLSTAASRQPDRVFRGSRRCAIEQRSGPWRNSDAWILFVANACFRNAQAGLGKWSCHATG